MDQWRIIACESSDYRHIVHDDGFVWLMFVHERFSASEQTLNSQNHGVHYMSVITRLTCNNSILLTRNSPDWQTYRDDTADDTVLCISGIVLGMTGLRLWLACVHKGNIRTSYSWYTRDNVCDSFRDVITSRWACSRATRSLEHVGTEIYRRPSLRHMTWINQSRPSIHPENLKSYSRVVEFIFTERPRLCRSSLGKRKRCLDQENWINSLAQPPDVYLWYFKVMKMLSDKTKLQMIFIYLFLLINLFIYLFIYFLLFFHRNGWLKWMT